MNFKDAYKLMQFGIEVNAYGIEHRINNLTLESRYGSEWISCEPTCRHHHDDWEVYKIWPKGSIHLALIEALPVSGYINRCSWEETSLGYQSNILWKYHLTTDSLFARDWKVVPDEEVKRRLQKIRELTKQDNS